MKKETKSVIFGFILLLSLMIVSADNEECYIDEGGMFCPTKNINLTEEDYQNMKRPKITFRPSDISSNATIMGAEFKIWEKRKEYCKKYITEEDTFYRKAYFNEKNWKYAKGFYLNDKCEGWLLRTPSKDLKELVEKRCEKTIIGNIDYNYFRDEKHIADWEYVIKSKESLNFDNIKFIKDDNLYFAYGINCPSTITYDDNSKSSWDSYWYT